MSFQYNGSFLNAVIESELRLVTRQVSG